MDDNATKGNWTQWTENQDQRTKIWGTFHGFWLGDEEKMRPYRDMPQGRMWAGGISKDGCNSDACRDRFWIAGGSTLDQVLSDVWTLEMEDHAWVKIDSPTKPIPGRFKSAWAMYEPHANVAGGQPRNLLMQPHLFQFLGVRDFLGGDCVADIWVLTQTDNTNPTEIDAKGVDAKGTWKMGTTGTMWDDTTQPKKAVEVVGPCVTGKEPGNDPICRQFQNPLGTSSAVSPG